MGDVRNYRVSAESTETFGRVGLAVREHQIVVDGPIENGCLGEAPTPGELFLGAVASCGVELIEVIARSREVSLDGLTVAVDGTVDRENPVRDDVSVFNRVAVHLTLRGVDQATAADLVDAFTHRCPLYGSVAASCPDVTVTFQAD